MADSNGPPTMTASQTSPTAVSPVRHEHVPNWFRLRLLREFGAGGGSTRGWYVLRRAIGMAEQHLAGHSGHPGWLDHWGSAVIDGEVCFVSEPYLAWPSTEDALRVASYLADVTESRLVAYRESAWNPGSTIRLVFKPSA